MSDKEKLEERMIALEKWKGELDIWKTKTEGQRAYEGLVHHAGQSAMRTALIINGGSAVAMLAFIGSLYNGTLDKSLLKAMAHSLLYNIIGVLVVGAAFGVIYLGYFLGLFGQEEENKLSRRYSICMDICNYSSWILVIASYTLFLIGAVNAYLIFIGTCGP